MDVPSTDPRSKELHEVFRLAAMQQLVFENLREVAKLGLPRDILGLGADDFRDLLSSQEWAIQQAAPRDVLPAEDVERLKLFPTPIRAPTSDSEWTSFRAQLLALLEAIRVLNYAISHRMEKIAGASAEVRSSEAPDQNMT